ncbi:jg26060, partial [Pararge aegeria aegeria]
CSYDYLEILESGLDNITEHGTEEWVAHDHHTYHMENEVWEEMETLLPESDAVSAGWSRDTHAARARRLCGDWGGKLKLLRYQSLGPALRLRFRADHSRHYAGYRAKVTLTDSK